MKRRLLAIFLCITIILSFTGCSTAELGFYNMAKEMLNLDEMTYKGSVKVDVDNFKITDSSTDAKTVLIADNVVKMLNQYTLNYDGVISKDKKTISLNLEVTDIAGNKAMDMKLMLIDKTVYVAGLEDDSLMQYLQATPKYLDGVEYMTMPIDTIIDKLAQFTESSLRDTTVYPEMYLYDETLTDIYKEGFTNAYQYGYYDGYNYAASMTSFDDSSSYTETDLEEYKTGYSQGYTYGYMDGQSSRDYNDKIQAQINESVPLIKSKANAVDIISILQSVETKSGDELINNFFNGFELGAIQKENDNKFTMSYDLNKANQIMQNMMTYIIENQDKIMPTVKNIINNITDDEFALFGVSPEAKQEMLAVIDRAASEMPPLTNAPNLSDIIISSPEMANPIEANYNLTLEKVGTSKYLIDSVTTMNSTEAVANIITFDASITSHLEVYNTKPVDPQTGGTDVITVQPSDPLIIPKDKFAEAKAASAPLKYDVLDTNGNLKYSWSFNGSDVTEALTDVNIEVKIGGENEAIIDNLTNDPNALVLSFTHSGQLPAQATVRVFVGDKYANGSTLYLYFYNPTTKALEYQSQVVTVTNGYAEVAITHCSDYVLVNELVTLKTTATDISKTTGDSSNIGWYISAFVVAAAAGVIFFVYKKRANNRSKK